MKKQLLRKLLEERELEANTLISTNKSNSFNNNIKYKKHKKHKKNKKDKKGGKWWKR